MRILCIGNIEGWMEIHLRQMLAGFERRGCVTAVADYNRMGRRFGFLKSSETGEFELRQRRLEKICAAGINIEYMYTVSAAGDDAQLIIKTSEPEKAEQILEKAGVEIG